MSNRSEATAKGTVIEALPNAHFRVELSHESSQDNEPQIVLAYLSGKMRLHRIRVMVGDTVEMVLDPYGGKPRIVRRQ